MNHWKFRQIPTTIFNLIVFTNPSSTIKYKNSFISGDFPYGEICQLSMELVLKGSNAEM